MRVVIYIRVSSDEQVGNFSLEAQEKACRQFAEARGWIVIAVYADPGLSAKNDARPQFRRMIADAKAGRFDVIMTHKLDRFSRSMIDTLTYLRDLEKCGVTYVSATEQFDFTTPMGKVSFVMMAAFAEMYIDNLSAETSKGKRGRAEAGYQNNATPFGYQKEKNKEAVAQFNPATLEGYRLAVRLALEGTSDLKIAWALNEAQYRTTRRQLFCKDTVAAMLQNPYYLGEVVYRKERHPGRHPAAVDKDSWEKIQAMRAARAVRPDKANVTARAFPLTTVLFCEHCGRGMRGHSMRGYRYYRDTAKEHGLTCPQPITVRAEVLEEQVGAYLARVVIPEDWRVLVVAMLGEEVGEAARVEKERRRLEGELDRAKRLYIAGDLTENEYTLERRRVTASLSNLVMPTLPDLSTAANLLTHFGSVWAIANEDEQKKLIRAMIARVWVNGKSVVGIEPKAEVYYLLSVAQSGMPVGSAVTITP